MLSTRRRLRRLYHIAHKHVQAHEVDLAWPYVSEMLNMDMDDAGALYLCGIVMRERGHIGLAAQLFRRAVSIDPKYSNVWLHFAACLQDAHQYAAAMQIWRMLDRKQPNNVDFLANMANTMLHQGKFHDALNTIDRVIELAGEQSRPGYQSVRGMACLALERWKEGFEGYRGLYGDIIVIRKYCQPEEPEWDGTPGKTIVVQCDQGIGDELRFSSVLPDLARDCTVILDCHPKLEHLFRRSFPQLAAVHGTRKLRVVDWLKDWKIDASHHISSLGRFYRKLSSDFPRKPYLVPDEERRAKWRARLAALPRPLVGLAWQGGSEKTVREHRSFDLATFLPLMEAGGSFIDLSYHDSSAEVARFNDVAPVKLLRFDIDTSNYDETLALVAELDLVVCVPTAILHAAGAIGKQCFVYTPNFPNWEFGNNRDDMIWYPPGVVRIFRGTIEDLRDAYLHWRGQPAADSLHCSSELDHPARKPPGADHAARAAAATHY
jgi:tetratricopeptide (TPR) repeat protein